MKREGRPIPGLVRPWIGILAGALLACGGSSWVSSAPVTFLSGGVEPEVIVARCVNRAREVGYSVDAVDYQSGSLRVVALRTDGVMLGIRPVPRSSSWLLVQVEADHSVTVRAYGDLVREQDARMHPELRAEMDWLARELEAAIAEDPRASEGQRD